MTKKLKFPGMVFIMAALCSIACTSDDKEDPPADKNTLFTVPDTGQTTSYTTTYGEDADYTINPVSFTDNGDGTVTDNITGLMWQKSDGGEMKWEDAQAFCSGLELGGYNDWRLPVCHELFSINSYQRVNPALFTDFFPVTTAEYWWTAETRADDLTRVWVVNAGGGIGAHPKTETISAGGAKKFHVRAVRDKSSFSASVPRFYDNGTGMITDSLTGLTWQKIQSAGALSWEEALVYAENLELGGYSDWRLPNIKELQSLNDESLMKPSFDKNFFTSVLSGNYWSSTTLVQATTRAWDINVDYGIVSYNDKTLKENVICVRGGGSK